MARDRRPFRLPYFFVPGLVLLVGVSATVLVVLQFLLAADIRDDDRLRLEADLAVSALQERIEGQSALLRGAAGLFAGSDEVSAEEFRAYVDRLDLSTRYPGVTGIGFARWGVGEAGRAAIEADMRRQGFADFHVWPAGRRRAYVPVSYISPLNDRNRSALGYDMFSEAKRREAVNRTAATGQLAATSKVQLVQDGDGAPQASFLVYLAVRNDGTDPDGIEGFVYSPMRARDLLQTVFPQRPDRMVDVDIFDGDPQPSNHMFGTDPPEARRARLHATRTVDIAGRTWTLIASTRPAFEASGSRAVPYGAAVAGALITIALTLAVLAQARGAAATERARRALHELNANLEDRVDARTRELRDEMSRREAAEDQVRQMQKMEAIGQLSGGIAHDFNNMLAIVTGSLDMAQRRLKGDEDPRVARYLENAGEGARRAALLTGRLLAFARRQQLQPRAVDPGALVNGLTDLFRRTLGERVDVQTQTSADVWPVRVDPGELENALLNLAVNARDAMPDGGRLLLSTVNAPGGGEAVGLPAGDYVAIRVADEGVGMPADVIERAFEPFFTTKNVGKGTGLGLSQVYGFVRQSGGEVTIESGLGVGTTVTILLPRWTGTATVREPRPGTPAGELPRANGETVLVVEDEADVRRISVEALNELGYAVLEAPEGTTALKILETGAHIDLLFTDVVMPGLSGFQLAEQARKTRPGLRVLYTTGYAHGALPAEGEATAVSPVVTKPFTLDQLARGIREALDNDAEV